MFAMLCAFPWRDPHSYGAPGVEFTGLHKDTTAVTQIHFLPGQVSELHAKCKNKTNVCASRVEIWQWWPNTCVTLMSDLLRPRAACCHCWMTTRFTCGSLWQVLRERWEGSRKRVWSPSRKWETIASQEDLALRAAGIQEPLVCLTIGRSCTSKASLTCSSSSQHHPGDCPPLAEVMWPALHWNGGRGRVLPAAALPVAERQPDAAPGSGHAEVRQWHQRPHRQRTLVDQ